MNTRLVTPLAWPSDAVLTMPGSKSSANRLLVIAAMAGHPVTVRGVTASDDVLRMVAGLRTLGFAVEHDEGSGTVLVAPRTDDAPDHGSIDCGNAGTALRFLTSVAALTPGAWTLTGDAAMQRRPIAPLVEAWRQLGVAMQATAGCPPIVVHGQASVRGGRVQIDASQSSQFVSSLLLVASRLQGAGLIVECPGPMASLGYAELTAAELQAAGITARVVDDRHAHVEAPARPVPAELVCAGDWSSFGVWTCLDHLTGSRVRATNLASQSGQPDEALHEALATLRAPGEATVDVGAMPDQFLNLAIVAAHRAGTTHLVGGANLRIKECDRIAVMARELTKLGVEVHERPDGLDLRGGRTLRPGIVDPANDHRVAMAFALAGLLSPGIAILDSDCVAKSYPGFWNDLETVRAQRRCVAIVGMRAAGKTTFARTFAAATGCAVIDTDARFVVRHGPIAEYVARHGWPRFRSLEQHFVETALLERTVVSTGGGACESSASRAILAQRTFVVWLDAPRDLLVTRLAADGGVRPSVTGAPLVEEIDALLARRNPQYAEIAHVRIDATLPIERQVQQVQAALGASCRWPGSGERRMT